MIKNKLLNLKFFFPIAVVSLLFSACGGGGEGDNGDNSVAPAPITFKTMSVSGFATDAKTLKNTSTSGSVTIKMNCPKAMSNGGDWVSTSIISNDSSNFQVLEGYACNFSLMQGTSSTKEIFSPQADTLTLNLDKEGNGTTMPKALPYVSSSTKNIVWFVATSTRYNLVFNYGDSPETAQAGASQSAGQVVSLILTNGTNGPLPQDDGQSAQLSLAELNGQQDYQLSFGAVKSPNNGIINCKIISQLKALPFSYDSINKAFNDPSAINCPAQTESNSFSAAQGNWNPYANDDQVIIWQNSSETTQQYAYSYLLIPKTSNWVFNNFYNTIPSLTKTLSLSKNTEYKIKDVEQDLLTIEIKCPHALSTGDDWDRIYTTTYSEPSFAIPSKKECDVTLNQFRDTNSVVYTPDPNNKLSFHLNSTGDFDTTKSYQYFNKISGQDPLLISASSKNYSLTLTIDGLKAISKISSSLSVKKMTVVPIKLWTSNKRVTAQKMNFDIICVTPQ